MICNPGMNANPGKGALYSHIEGHVRDLCGDDLYVDDVSLAEMARAVEQFLESCCNGSVVDSKYVLMLASQALSSIGHTHAARRLLLFGTGLMRPSEWEVTGERAVWALDLKEITVSDDAPLELLFFGSLVIILESIADVWDETRGRGVLGLRHVCMAASALLGESGSRREVSTLSDEIKETCRRKLTQIKEQRCWEMSPEVLNLDVEDG